MNNRDLKETMWKRKNDLRLKRSGAKSKAERDCIDKEIEKCNAVLSHIETRTSARLHTTNLF